MHYSTKMATAEFDPDYFYRYIEQVKHWAKEWGTVEWCTPAQLVTTPSAESKITPARFTAGIGYIRYCIDQRGFTPEDRSKFTLVFDMADHLPQNQDISFRDLRGDDNLDYICKHPNLGQIVVINPNLQVAALLRTFFKDANRVLSAYDRVGGQALIK